MILDWWLLVTIKGYATGRSPLQKLTLYWTKVQSFFMISRFDIHEWSIVSDVEVYLRVGTIRRFRIVSFIPFSSHGCCGTLPRRFHSLLWYDVTYSFVRPLKFYQVYKVFIWSDYRKPAFYPAAKVCDWMVDNRHSALPALSNPLTRGKLR